MNLKAAIVAAALSQPQGDRAGVSDDHRDVRPGDGSFAAGIFTTLSLKPLPSPPNPLLSLEELRDRFDGLPKDEPSTPLDADRLRLALDGNPVSRHVDALLRDPGYLSHLLSEGDRELRLLVQLDYSRLTGRDLLTEWGAGRSMEEVRHAIVALYGIEIHNAVIYYETAFNNGHRPDSCTEESGVRHGTRCHLQALEMLGLLGVPEDDVNRMVASALEALTSEQRTFQDHGVRPAGGTGEEQSETFLRASGGVSFSPPVPAAEIMVDIASRFPSAREFFSRLELIPELRSLVVTPESKGNGIMIGSLAEQVRSSLNRFEETSQGAPP